MISAPRNAQKRHSRRAAGQCADLTQHHHTKRDHQRTDNDRQRIFNQRVPDARLLNRLFDVVYTCHNSLYLRKIILKTDFEIINEMES